MRHFKPFLFVLLFLCASAGCRIHRWDGRSQNQELLVLLTNYQNAICSKRVVLFDETHVKSVWVYDAIVVAEENEDVLRMQKELKGWIDSVCMDDTIKIISKQHFDISPYISI